MSEYIKPILFRAEMVRSLLAGTKTQTRRLIMPSRYMQMYASTIGGLTLAELNSAAYIAYTAKLHQGWQTKYKAGESLYVKETWAVHATLNKTKPSALPHGTPVVYRADPGVNDSHYMWRSSLFMPYKFSRITLNILSVRTQRLNDMSEEEAKAEGVASLAEYRNLWDKINAKKLAWKDNPWVYVIEFFAYAHTKVAK